MSVDIPQYSSSNITSWLKRTSTHTPLPVPDSVNTPLSRLTVIATKLLEERRIERNTANSSYKAALSELTRLDRAVNNAKEKCRRTNHRVHVLQAQFENSGDALISSGWPDASCGSDLDDATSIVLRDILSSGEVDQEFFEQLQFESFSHRLDPPQADKILAIAAAAQEESCAEKVAIEHQFRRSLLLYRLHEGEFQKAERAYLAAEQAVSSIRQRYPSSFRSLH
ncbi:hypothetical protein BV22DRAFT_1051798 [Leucogyrophana mollusca]|uniref:Uncharacterized protein n=1 Tax=Leucogyrophana mollusca TaxID=85980 RepID=A0ACB8AZC7_9AGAM|nr:hypothetical protein BV22DRAFT_1051798 [Leucogyrophana mollusca]